MSKLPRVTGKEMVRARLRTVVPIRGRALGPGLTHSILKQAGLPAEDLRRLLK